MRLVAPFLLGLVLLVVDQNVFVAGQDNITDTNETVAAMTEAPTDELIPVEYVETEAPSDTLTMEEVANATVSPDDETIAPTMEETEEATGQVIEVDDGASNVTDFDDTAQVPVGNVTIETDETQAPNVTECVSMLNNGDVECGQLLTFTTAVCDCYNFCSGKLIACVAYGERNSFSCSGETVAGCTMDQKTNQTEVPNVTEAPAAPEPPMVTSAPTEAVIATESPVDVVTEPPVDVPTENVTVTETTSPTETPLTGDDIAPTDDSGGSATECAVMVNNEEAVCGQLLKFTTAVCDCYNFCSGKLIACLEYGERNSFSCSGETVAGCTTEQKATSAAPQQLVGSMAGILVAALPALLVV